MNSRDDSIYSGVNRYSPAASPALRSSLACAISLGLIFSEKIFIGKWEMSGCQEIVLLRDEVCSRIVNCWIP